jgi:periplasmic divalent cation tolerance protein
MGGVEVWQSLGVRDLPPLSGRLAQLRENDKPVLIYATFPSVAEAERVGGALVDQGLAACVNILPGMVAIYVWEGKRQRESEAAMLIKTRTSLAAGVVGEVRKLHPYSNPALLILPVEGGSQDFLKWIAEQTGRPGDLSPSQAPTALCPPPLQQHLVSC